MSIALTAASTDIETTRATGRTGWWARRKWDILRIGSPLALLVLWQLGSAVGVMSGNVLPAPSVIIQAGVELTRNGQLIDALQVSGLRVIEGLLLGGVAGDPYTAQAEQQIAVRSIAEARGVTNGDWLGVASDQALADPQRNTALSDLLVRFEKAVQWAKAHPGEWAQSYAAAVGMEARAAAVSQARSLRLPTELGDAVVASEQRLVDLFAAARQIQSSPKFANWVDRRFNDVLRPNLVDTQPVRQAGGR